MPRVKIRPMQNGDLAKVVEIEKACFGERWTINAFINELQNKASTYVVEEYEGEVIGYAGYWLILEEAHITTIGVDPNQQGHGYGELMLHYMIEHAAKAGAKWVTLEVRASNVVAQRLYEKYGFTSLGRRRGYYQDNNEDALVMWTENIWQEDYQERLKELKEALAKRGTSS